MIELPRRSVTRFFIPLIDVLTLLFCIFLLMPVMKGKADGPGSAESGPRPDSGLIAGDPLVTDAAELTRRITRAEQDLERLVQPPHGRGSVGRRGQRDAVLQPQ